MKKDGNESLESGDRLIVGLGIGLAVIFTVGLGVLMFALKHSDMADYDSPETQKLSIAPDYSRQLIDFSLTDQTGQTITRKDFEGKYLVVSFIFTSCSVTCPTVSRQMARIQEMTRLEPDIRLVSLTVDPEDDTVPVLKQFSGRYGAEPARWSFLTGDVTTMHHLVSTSFLWQDKASQFSYMPGNFAHIERIAIVDPQGHIHRYFNGLNKEAAEAVVREIKQLKKSNP